MSDGGDGRRALGIALALLALGLALHLPGIGRPFGVHEISGGNYFGVFARNFERLGLLELRGVPVGPVLFETADDPQITPYLSHPPGLFWLMAAVGADEARLRLLSALGHIAAALLTFALFRRPLGLWPAALAGAATLLFPVLAFFALVSYESLVLPLGIATLLAYLRSQEGEGRVRRRWLAGLGAASLIGPWMDWQYLFFCVGLAVLAAGSWRRMLARLWVPAAGSTLSVALILAWRAWAQGRWAEQGAPKGGLDALLQNTVGTRPATGEFLAGTAQRALECFSSPAVLLALVGVWWLARRAPRLAAALAVVGLLNPLVFPTHSMTHTLYLAYLAPLAAGAIAAAVAHLPRGPAVAAAALVALAAGWATIETRRLSATPFFRDLGRELTAAAGTDDERWAVLFNLPYCYGYYVDSSRVSIYRVTDPALLETWRTPAYAEAADVRGIRYLWVRSEPAGGQPPAFPPAVPTLDAYLARFPASGVPELQQLLVTPPVDPLAAWFFPGLGSDAVRIAEARLITLEP